MPYQPKKIKKEALFFASCLGLVFILFLSALNLNLFTKKDLTTNKVLGINIQKEEEISSWKEFLSQNPDYLPGWIDLATLEKEKGNISGYQEALENIARIDPNSEYLSQEDF